MKRYSLANYIMSISPTDVTLRSMFGTISVGGEGSYLGNIAVSQNSNLWDTKGYATGAWVHNKNLDRTGLATIQLNQLAQEVNKLIKLFNVFYSGDYAGSTITVSDLAGNKVATCTDCYIQKIADQSFSDTAADQSWTFTCGRVVFG